MEIDEIITNEISPDLYEKDMDDVAKEFAQKAETGDDNPEMTMKFGL